MCLSVCQGKLDKSAKGFGGEAGLRVLRSTCPVMASFTQQASVLLLPLLFQGILCVGPSPEGKEKPGGMIPVVGYSRVEKGSAEDLGAGSNTPHGCPSNLHARLVLGNISLTPQFPSLILGRRNWVRGKGR